MSAPTRVRRFLSRFMVVVIVSLSIEALVSVFQFAHDDPTQLIAGRGDRRRGRRAARRLGRCSSG